MRAHNDIEESLQRGWAQLEALLKPKENSVAVFNPVNWERSGIVETDLPAGTTLIDTTSGAPVPLEVLRQGKGIALPGFGPGSVRVRFLASDVPAVGYKLFAVKASKDRPQTGEQLQSSVIENRFYRVTLDVASGAVSSIIDKQTGRELVDNSSPYKFGAYLYVSGGDDYPNNSLYRFGAGLKPPALTPQLASRGAIVSESRSSLGTTVVLRSSAPNTPSIETEIFLPASQKTIAFTYRVHKERVLTRESAYIAFPFAITHPEFAYGSQAAWIDPAKNELPGGSREWYVPTTWAAVHDRQVSAAIVPLDAPLVTFGDIMRGEWPSEFKPKSSTVFSWLMNNYWGTNFPASQGGEFTFRYAMTSSAGFDAPSLTRFGWSALTPLERDDIAASQDGSALPPSQASLLHLDAPGITMLTWKSAEDGDGTILRLQETAGSAREATISSDYIDVSRAWLCNALEDKQSELPTNHGAVNVTLQPFQTITIRMHTAVKPR